jgi:phage terminase large subunit
VPEIVRQVPPPKGKASWPKAGTWDAAWWAAWLRGKGWTDPEIVQYLNDRARLTLSVTKGQGKSAQTTVLYAPGPRAVQFHDSLCPNLLYGGAAGGMKSYSARWDIYMRMLRTPGSKFLLLRRTFTELEDNHLNDSDMECRLMAEAGVPIRFLKDDKKVVVERPGQDPSFLRYGHCQNVGDEEKYLSNAYDGAYLDEAATFEQKQAMGVQTRLRSVVTDDVFFRCMSNPGGAQTLWLKRYFIDRAVTEDEHEDYVPEEWGFIFSQLYDNPYYMDPDGTWTKYARRLKGYGPERARQMLDGDWDAIAGQFFSEFRRDRHVEDLGPVPDGVQWFRCLDWGYNQPGVCYWVACLPDGRLYVVHEYWFRQTLVADVAKEIRRITKTLGSPHIRYTVADGHMFDRTGTGETMAETSARNGVALLRADNSKGSRPQGWQRLRHWLTDAPDGKPWLIIHPGCGYLVRTLPALVGDDTNPDDVNTQGDDHGADAIRYGVMSRPSPTVLAKEDRIPGPGTAGALMREAMAWARRGGKLGDRNVRLR